MKENIKIMISEPVPPWTVNPPYYAWAQQLAPKVARPGSQVDYVALRGGYRTGGAYAQGYNGFWMAQRAYEAEKKGYDAFVVGCAGDLNLKGCRSLVNIPVVGSTEAASHLCSILGNKFSVIVMMPEHAVEVEQLITEYGLKDKLASIRTALGLVGKIEDQKKIEILTSEMAKAVREDGAEALFIGHVPDGMFLSMHGIQEIEGAPIVDAFSASIKFAEMLIDLKRVCGTVFCKKSIYKSPPPGWEQQFPIKTDY